MTKTKQEIEPTTRFNRGANGTSTFPLGRPRPSVAFDPSPYLPLLADLEISEADKHLLLGELWKIVTCFVAMGWSVHPVQHAIEAQQSANCGQVKDNNAGLAGAVLSLVDAQSSLAKMRRMQ